jgi:hypothetical protein
MGSGYTQCFDYYIMTAIVNVQSLILKKNDGASLYFARPKMLLPIFFANCFCK